MNPTLKIILTILAFVAGFTGACYLGIWLFNVAPVVGWVVVGVFLLLALIKVGYSMYRTYFPKK